MTATDHVDAVGSMAVQLQRFVAEHYGADAQLFAVRTMPGHAGLSFGFEVWRSGSRIDDLVLRIPPMGVRRSGNTDVLRQAPLLGALNAEGLPVARVVWSGEDERWFGVPYLIVERLDGETCFPWDPQPGWDRTGQVIPDLWRSGAHALVRVHQVDWQAVLPGWTTPRPVSAEVARWQSIYEQSPEAAWIEAADEVRQLLLQTQPAEEPVGLIHGDYQIGNLLFVGARITGIIDWELSGIGAHLIDVGWYLSFADPEGWHDRWGPVNPAPVAELQEIYEQGMGRAYPDLDWYRALAGYRIGAISCLNVKLHRSGKRPDDVWERYALATPQLFAHARDLLLERQGSTRRAR